MSLRRQEQARQRVMIQGWSEAKNAIFAFKIVSAHFAGF